MIETALGIFTKTYQQRDIELTKEHYTAIKESLSLFDDICKGGKTERYVLALPTGTGKTTAIVSWCAANDQINKGYSVCIASAQVSELFKIRKDLIAHGVSVDKIGVLYSDKQDGMEKYKDIAPSTNTPEKDQILLVTHKRYEYGISKTDYLHCKGKKRNIIFWDEAFRKTQNTSNDISELVRLLYGDLRILDKNDFQSLDDFNLIKRFLETIIKKLEDRKEGTSIIEDCTLMKSFRNREEDMIIKKYLKDTIKKRGTDLYNFCCHVLNEGFVYFSNSKAITTHKIIQDNVKRMVILDASYSIDGISQLDKSIKMIPTSYKRHYSNLSIKYRLCPSGKLCLSDRGKRTDILDQIASDIKSIPKNEAILIMVHKQNLNTVISELSKKSINHDKFLDNGKKKYNFLTWGKEKGTNEFVHCSHFIHVGLLDIGNDNLYAQAVAETDGDYISCPENQIFKLRELEELDYAQRLYQAISRLAIRNPNYKKLCTVNLYTWHNRYIPHLRKVFPGAPFESRPSVFPTKETKTDQVYISLIEHLEIIPDYINSISSIKLLQNLREEIGDVSNQVWRQVRKRYEKEKRSFIFREWEFNKRTLVRSKISDFYDFPNR